MRQQQLDLTIQNLDDQIQDLANCIKNQISTLTGELCSVLVSVHISSSSPSLSSSDPPVNNVMPSCPSHNTSSSHESSTHPSLSQQTVIVQPPTTAPVFSDKVDDKPRPFLIRLNQYTSSTYGWNNEKLFQNIGQFLKETVLEWYTQVSASTSPPTNWDTFQTLFLQQFSSPLRLAQLEQEWKTCVQEPTESINEFLVRLRTLWFEHKPKQTERDLIRYLFAKVRPELVSLIGVLNDPTLENFIERAREAEAIEYSLLKQSTQNKEFPFNSPSK